MTTNSQPGNGPEPAAFAARFFRLAFYCFTFFFMGWLFHYYMTGAGGPTLLAVRMVPLVPLLLMLDSLRKNKLLYPRLGRRLNYAIAAVYAGVCLASAVYLSIDFYAIRYIRLGSWNTWDLLAGGAVFALVMEFTRKRYFPVFVTNMLLILYAVYGSLIPGMFGHPGLPWKRILTAGSLEMTTGVFERLPQLALTLIGSFILLLAVMRAFGCIDSIVRLAIRVGARSPRLIPQVAVIASFGAGAVSGSGAANAATTGAATIPTLKGLGFTAEQAAAVESAASKGGQLLPPIMGITAFLMAEMMHVSYFEVVLRGFVPALVFFIGLSGAVYLICSKRVSPEAAALQLANTARVNAYDIINLVVYVGVVGALIFLLGRLRWPAMLAAQTVFLGLGGLLLAVHIWRSFRQSARSYLAKLRRLGSTILEFGEHFSTMTADLTLLLAALGVLAGFFSVTGVPPKIGTLIVEYAGIHLALMVFVAWIFGLIVGMGLPPSADYLIIALIVAGPLVRAGVPLWVAHFFAFFQAVWGELTPPTSVVSAVTSRIAGASYTKTMLKAIGLCTPLTVLTAVVFTYPDLVVEPFGALQLRAGLFVLVGTMGLLVSLFGRYNPRRTIGVPLRILTAAVSLALLLVPSLALLLVFPVLALTGYGFWQTRQIGDPDSNCA